MDKTDTAPELITYKSLTKINRTGPTNSDGQNKTTARKITDHKILVNKVTTPPYH